MTLNDSLENMYDLFNRFDGFEDFFLKNQFDFTSIKSESSDWPNYTYNLKYSQTNFDVFVKEIANRIQKFEISPFVLFLKEATEIEESLYSHGIRKIETWPVMTIETQDFSKTLGKLPDVSDEFCIVKTEMDLDTWFNLVKRVLFNKRKLNIEHFRKLQLDNQFSLLLIKNKEVGISAALVYLGEKYAGLYMVATDDSYRGKGYGKFVTNKAIEYATKEGKQFLTLQSSRMAYPMYKSIGFNTLGEIDVYWMIGTQFK